MDNPYLREYNARSANLLDGIIERQHLTRKYAWAVPSEEAIRLIASCGPIVEIGAGTGYWAWLLRQVGADIVAYDNEPYRSHYSCGKWSEVEIGGPEKAEEHHDRALFLCWPPYDDSFADECLANYESAGGKIVIYIGEYKGGCTADDSFHERLSKSWEVAYGLDIPTYCTIHDFLRIYLRRD